MERTWDIDPTNVSAVIQEKLEAGPQLCMVLAKDVKPDTIFNLVKNHYLFSSDIDAEDRLIVLCGAYKDGVEMGPVPERTQKVFGRELTEQIHDDLVHIGEVPYMPFCKNLDPKVIKRMRDVFDIREVEYNSESRTAILGYYYDAKNVPPRPGRVIAQSRPIIQNPNINN